MDEDESYMLAGLRRMDEDDETVRIKQTLGESTLEEMRRRLPFCRSDSERARILIGIGLMQLERFNGREGDRKSSDQNTDC